MRYMLHDGIARRMFIILLSAGDRCACRSIYCFYWRRRANSYFENCTRERLPRDRQLVGLVWSTSIGRNLNVISHKSQRVIAVVVTNLMVPRMQPKMYNNHIWADKWRSSAYDENRSFVHATTQWFQMENQMRRMRAARSRAHFDFIFCENRISRIFPFDAGLCVIYVSGRLFGSRGHRPRIGAQRSFT